jgi:ribose transport system permease protein
MSTSQETLAAPRSARWRELASNPTLLSVITFLVLLQIWNYYNIGGLRIADLSNLFSLMITLALAGFGTTIVIIAGGFDLSVAGLVSIANVVVATQMTGGGANAVLVSVAVIGIGLTVGLLNGFLIAYLGIESIAATLATYIASSGVALLILAAPGGSVPQVFSGPLTAVVLGVLPAPLLTLLGLGALWIVLRRTRFGVQIFALGADETAAGLSAVRTRRVKLGAYALAGVMYSLAGLYYSAVIGTGDPTSGTPFLVSAFAAAALGGCSFAGGAGSAIGTIFGAGVLALIPKVLFVFGVASFYTQVVQGVVLVLAVLFAIVVARIARRTA